MAGVDDAIEVVQRFRRAEDGAQLPAPRVFYVEMAGYGFEAYVYAFVLPYFRDQLRLVSGMDELVARSDLRSVADGLRGNPKIRHFANRNDFLTTPEDVAWLSATLGAERVTLFPTGGHLGNLYKPEVQAEIMASLADLAPAP
jgi:hypothetical protein